MLSTAPTPIRYAPSSAFTQLVHAPPHALPTGLLQLPILVQFLLVVLVMPPLARLATNLSGCLEFGNLQTHSSFEVGESSTQSKAHEQGLSPGFTKNQLGVLRQQIDLTSVCIMRIR